MTQRFTASLAESISLLVLVLLTHPNGGPLRPGRGDVHCIDGPDCPTRILHPHRWWLGIIIAPIMTVLIGPGLRMDRRNPEKTTLAPSNRDPTNSRFGSDFVLDHGGRHLVMG
jgi:hypothetical protein